MGRRRTILVGAAALAVAAGAFLFARAVRRESAPANTGDAWTRPKPARPVAFPDGEALLYEFGLNGVAAATLRVCTTLGTDAGAAVLTVTYDIRSSPAIETLWQYSATGRSLIDERTLLPVRSERSSESGEKQKSVSVVFDRPAGMARIERRRSAQGRVKKREKPCAGLDDMASALLLLRSIDMDAGGGARLLVLSGEDVYEVLATPAGEEEISVAAGVFQARAVDMALREVVEPDESDEPKSRQARIWLARDRGVPVRLASEVLLGEVYAELQEVGPAAPAGE